MSTPAHDFYLTGARREIVHRAGCRKLAKAKRPPAGWPLGDGLTPTQLRDALAERGERRTEPLCAWKGCGRRYSDPIHVLDHGFVHANDLRGR